MSTYLQAIRCVRSHIYNGTFKCSKAYYCDKKKLIVDLNIVNTEAKKETCISEDDNLKIKSPGDIEKDAFDNEDDILQFVLTEKERDANVRSRLSKECSTLLADKKISLTSSGLNLHLEHHDLQHEINWENYPFSDAMELLKKHSAAPIVTAIPIKAAADAGKASSGSAPSPPSSTSRIIRAESGKVILGFVPEEWWKFFMPKTGVTGFFTFLFTCGTFLVSKEYYVLEHNYYGGISFAILWYYAIKHVGPIISDMLDKEIDQYEKAWAKTRTDQEDALNQEIEEELLVQFQAEGEVMLVAAKRENVLLQLEAEFRNRQMYVYEEVKNRLDYQVALIMAHRRIIHKNLVEYVTREVRKSITPDMEGQLIDISIQSIVSEFEKNSQPKE